MRRFLTALSLFAMSCAAAPAIAGDADAGARLFTKCKACHSITAPDGTDIARGGKVGPNLYGVIGRKAASYPGFTTYGPGLKAAGDAGLIWSEDLIAEYVKNPTAFIDSHGGTGASRMMFRLPEGGEDIAAYLATLH